MLLFLGMSAMCLRRHELMQTIWGAVAGAQVKFKQIGKTSSGHAGARVL